MVFIVPRAMYIYVCEVSARLTKFCIMYYQGYCAWALVKYDRLLLPGNPEVGVLKHKDCYYCFSSRAAAEEFSENIDRYSTALAMNFCAIFSSTY